MNNEIITMTLASGEPVLVKITVLGFPEFPTPLEPDVSRPPTMAEFIEILGNLQNLNFNIGHE